MVGFVCVSWVFLLVFVLLLEVLWIRIFDIRQDRKACKKKLQPNWMHNHLKKATRCKKRIYKGWKKDLGADTTMPLRSGTVGIK